MGEGVDTKIPVEKRVKTFDHLREAGLSLQTCVEPIGPEHTVDELTEVYGIGQKTLEKIRPYCVIE